MLTYITENKDKIFLAQNGLRSFNIPFKTQALKLVEIQSSSIEEIARLKAEQAFEKIKSPLFITDHGWAIPSLNGFPGPYMKYVNEWFTAQDFLNLMSKHKNRTIVNTEILCYIDQSGCNIFTAKHEGKFIEKIRGNGFAANQVVSMTNDGKSIAECIEQGIDPFNDNTLWNEFGKWYKKIKHHTVSA